MNKTLILFLISILMFEGCSKIKSLLPFSGKKKEKEGITKVVWKNKAEILNQKNIYPNIKLLLDV